VTSDALCIVGSLHMNLYRPLDRHHTIPIDTGLQQLLACPSHSRILGILISIPLRREGSDIFLSNLTSATKISSQNPIN
jgi:hypothetical protein